MSFCREYTSADSRGPVGFAGFFLPEFELCLIFSAANKSIKS